MGFVYKTEEFNKVLEALESKYRIFAPVLKVGEGRFRDTDVTKEKRFTNSGFLSGRS